MATRNPKASGDAAASSNKDTGRYLNEMQQRMLFEVSGELDAWPRIIRHVRATKLGDEYCDDLLESVFRHRADVLSNVVMTIVDSPPRDWPALESALFSKIYLRPMEGGAA